MSQNTARVIDVQDLRKDYPGRSAVGGVSFFVPKGEIVGLLGPNGAGKSTILRILSCFMPADSGTARVAGFDVFREPDDVRKRIGYMPENNPLHPDMRVRDYLKFRARLKGLGFQQTRESVSEVIGRCGLADVSRRIIGQLSKGYRQRVGLADALVHKPDLILLDEPTIGLDPNQMRLFRELILSLGGCQTVLLSSHLLSEVEMICGRIIILHEGKVLVSETKRNLLSRVEGRTKTLAEIQANLEDLKACLEGIEPVEECDVSPMDGGYCRCALTGRDGVDLRPMVSDQARLKGWPLRELTLATLTLEDVYLRVVRYDAER